jgi:arginine transport system substrate-binding protein
MSALLSKYFIALLTTAAVLGFIGMTVFQEHEKPSHETLVVGLQSEYPPFEFMDAHGKIVGFDIDVAARIAEKLGKTLVINNMEFEGQILSLKQGKIDLIMSGMEITHSRLKEILMVPYHGEAVTTLSLIFWNEIPQGVHSLEDVAKLPNPTVSVEAGAIPELYMSRYQDIQTKSLQGALAPLMDVKFGKSVANLVAPDVAKYLKKKHSEIHVLDVPLSEEDATLGFGIGIKKENQELFQLVQQIIQELKTSGELKHLEDKWFKGGE